MYELPACAVEISRASVLVDTNVLIRAFVPGELKHDYARYFIDNTDMQVIVPAPVVVEAWGLFTKLNALQYGHEFFGWLNTSDALLIPMREATMDGVHRLMRELDVDTVDAMLVGLADDISRRCELEPAIAIATFDTRDFIPIRQRRQYLMQLYDVEQDVSY